MKKIKSEGVLSFVLAFMMAVTMLIPSTVMQAFAADQVGNGSEGIMAYHHSKLSDPKYVDYNYDQGKPNYTEASDLGINPWYVYCVNPARNARDYSKWNQHFRWRWNLGANKWLLDNSKNQNAQDDPSSAQKGMLKGSEAYDDLAKILYYGYPNNYDGGNFSYNDTQDAVEGLLCGTSNKQNELYKKAINSNITVNGNLYMFIVDSDAKQSVQNTVGLAVWGIPSTPTEPNPPTPDKPNNYNDDSSEPTVSVSVSAKKKVTGEGAPASDQWKDKQFAFKLEGNGKEEAMLEVSEQEANDGIKFVHTRWLGQDVVEGTTDEVFFGDITFKKEGKYTFKVYELDPNDKAESVDGRGRPLEGYEPIEGMVYDDTEYSFEIEVKKEGSTLKAYYKGNDVSNSIIGKDEFEFVNTIPTPALKTTVTAGGKTGTADKAATLTAEEASKVTSVTDKIDYEGLVKGNTYKVEGTLYNVTDKDKVATASEELKAEDTKGTWEITFTNVTLEAGKTYVVFEKATPIKDADGNEIKDGKTIKHEDEKDLAQTIVVESTAPEQPTSDEPSQKEGTLKTTVSAKGHEASATEPAKIKTVTKTVKTDVTDTIDYEGLVAGNTYKVEGSLIEVDTDKVVATASDNLKAEAADGTWKITFENVELKAGKKYVVFENATPVKDSANKDITDGKTIKHEDKNDKAQTLVIVAQDAPGVIKKVESHDSVEVDNLDDSLTFTLTSEVPWDISKWVLTDNLPEPLVYVDGTVSVTADGKTDDDLAELCDTSETSVELVLDEDTVPAISDYYGKKIVVKFHVAIDDSVDLLQSKFSDPVTNVATVKSDGVMGEYNPGESENEASVLGIYDAAEKANEDGDGNSNGSGSRTRGVDTGDNNPVTLLLIVMIAAALATSVILVRRRRAER